MEGMVVARSFLVVSLFRTSKEDMFEYELKHIKNIPVQIIETKNK